MESVSSHTEIQPTWILTSTREILDCIRFLKANNYLKIHKAHLKLASGRSKGAQKTSSGSKFFQFHAVFLEKLAKSYVGGLAPPPRGNPGSATASVTNFWNTH